MATGSKTMKGFKVSCPSCGEAETVHIDLNDLTVCKCGSCDDEFSPEAARKKAAEELARWESIIRWIAMAGDALAE